MVQFSAIPDLSKWNKMTRVYLDRVHLSNTAFTTFGEGCASTTSLPAISSTGVPRLGRSFALDIRGLLPKPQFGQLIFGASNTMWGFIPLPMDLSVLGMNTCNLLVSLDTSGMILTNAQGNFSTTFKVPNLTSLLGATVHGQAWAGDKHANPVGVAMPDGFKAVVGY